MIKQVHLLTVGLLVLLLGGPAAFPLNQAGMIVRQELLANLSSRIQSRRLPNGMNIVCMPAENTNEVTVGAFVLVGSADEDPTEHGLAHILEHMVFKGTKTRKEGHLDRLAARFGMRLGVDYNAITSHDATLYYFASDEKNWQVFADVVVDSTQNLDVNPAALDSELHAIAQEIKTRQEDVNGFQPADFLPMNHPYAHRIIGYKEQVLMYTADQVMAFYKKHYVPEKMTFFVFGKVDPEKVFAYAQKSFAKFKRRGVPAKTQPVPFYAGFTTTAKTIYHTQQYRVNAYIWEAVAQSHPDYASLEWACTLLNRRLKKKFVDTLGYCFGTSVGLIGMGRTGMIAINLIPRPESYGVDFDRLIQEEIAALQFSGITDQEYAGICQEQLLQLIAIAEHPSALANQLINCAASNQDLITEYFQRQEDRFVVTADSIKGVFQKYMSSFLMHKVMLVPLPAEQYQAWNVLQEKVAQQEAMLLGLRPRLDQFVPSSYSDVINLPARIALVLPELPEIKTFTMPNGLTVYVVAQHDVPRCACSLVFKDAEKINLNMAIAGKEMVGRLVGNLLINGSAKYSSTDLDNMLTEQGCSLMVDMPKVEISSLKHNFDQSLALSMAIFQQRDFLQSYFDQKRREYKEAILVMQNNPNYILNTYLSQTFYKNYPWLRSEAQLLAELEAVTFDDVSNYLDIFSDPERTALIFSGDITEEQARQYVEKYFSFMRPAVSAVPIDEISVPSISGGGGREHLIAPTSDTLLVAMRPSCTDDAVDAPALELVASYLNKKLFEVRERTGLFYSGGAVVARGSGRIPGQLKFAISATTANIPAITAEVVSLIAQLGGVGFDQGTFDILKQESAQAVCKYVNTTETLLKLVSEQVINNRPFNYANIFAERVTNVSYSEFCSVVKKYFDIRDWLVVAIGPK